MYVFKWNSVSSRLDLDTAFDITFRHELACTITSPDRDNYAFQRLAHEYESHLITISGLNVF